MSPSAILKKSKDDVIFINEAIQEGRCQEEESQQKSGKKDQESE